MPKALPDHPSTSFPSQERIDRFRRRQAINTHLAPYGPKPYGRQGTVNPAAITRAAEAARNSALRFRAEFDQNRRTEAAKAERERILYGSKPTLEQRLAAIPPPTYTPITPKPVLLNFEKLTTADLTRIFAPKFAATLKRFDVFETFQFSEEIDVNLVNDVNKLIERITHLQRSLKDTACTRVKEEWQSWNYGLKEIGSISFKGLRKNQAQIVKALSAVYRTNYFDITR